ncbi:potassium channel subfamily K member 10-like [Procambarus clarkii]|uniref:potassium channel subfamily K member 10-like n=1 Tax=Procambarus clarkii TaxID=6728 RepID=UPI0037434991
MFYTILGVPLNMILIITLAGFFSSMVMNAELRRWARQYQSWAGVAAEALLYLGPGIVVFLLVPATVFNQVEDGWDYFDSFYYSFITITTVMNAELRRWARQYQSWAGVAAEALLYLGPGIVVFLLVPATVFNQVEDGWDYFDSFYYSFITITTVGFGDLVAGLQEDGGLWLVPYKMMIVVWIFLGFGYDYMIVTLIQRGLRSEKIHNVERKLVSALKRRTNRLNENVHSDLQHIKAAVITIVEERDQRLHPNGAAEGEHAEVTGAFQKPASRRPSLQVKSSDSSAPSDFSFSASQFQTLQRAVSDSRLNNGCKARVEELESLSNINMLLDMVETMVQERNAMAAQDMQHEFRHIVEDEDDSTSSDDGSDSPGDCERSLTTHCIPKTSEAHFLYKPHTLDDTHCDDHNTIHDKLLKKVHFLSQLTYPRKASLPESVQHYGAVKSPWRPAGENARVKTQPSSTSFLENMRHISHSLPGRVKAWTEETRPHFNSIFVHPKANLSLFSQWIHYTDEGSKDQRPTDQRTNNRNGPTTGKR